MLGRRLAGLTNLKSKSSQRILAIIEAIEEAIEVSCQLNRVCMAFYKMSSMPFRPLGVAGSTIDFCFNFLLLSLRMPLEHYEIVQAELDF